jgi:hypothetical protein
MEGTFYHGSPKKLELLTSQKASAPEGRPEAESLEAIYLSPDFSFSLICGIRPANGKSGGVIMVDHGDKIVECDDLSYFNPNQIVYIYTLDLSDIPDEKIVKIDKFQMALLLDSIKPVKCEERKAGEILRWYRLMERKKI